jgi:glycosyltransferase involved in cell wall biosynthesis
MIIAANSIVYDPRIGKIARSLKRKYPTRALGWNREGLSSSLVQDYTVGLDLLNLKAPFNKPSLVLYFPLFWIWVTIKLFIYRPAVIHACDLDTLLPSYFYKLLFRRALVFDVFDRYAGLIPGKFGTLSSIVNLFEELLAKRTDVLITVSNKVLETFRRKPKHCLIIMNCSEDYDIHLLKANASSKQDSDDDKGDNSENKFNLVYTGAIYPNLGLEVITAAIKDLEDVQLVMAGRIIDEEFLNQILVIPNVKYKGLLQYRDALSLEANSDALIVLYDLKYSKNALSSPNKIFEAMMCGIPVITNMEKELVNDEVACGITVDYDDINQIKAAISSLKDDKQLRKKLGDNGRRAFERKYNWTNMEEKLYKLYGNLLQNKIHYNSR